MLDIRIEPRGPASERGVAQLCATTQVRRDPAARLGEPAATARVNNGGEAIALLVTAATMALGDADLHITLQRS